MIRTIRAGQTVISSHPDPGPRSPSPQICAIKVLSNSRIALLPRQLVFPSRSNPTGCLRVWIWWYSRGSDRRIGRCDTCMWMEIRGRAKTVCVSRCQLECRWGHSFPIMRLCKYIWGMSHPAGRLSTVAQLAAVLTRSGVYMRTFRLTLITCGVCRNSLLSGVVGGDKGLKLEVTVPKEDL